MKSYFSGDCDADVSVLVMFQPLINENVYRALQQRLDSIDRNVRDDTSLEELNIASNLLGKQQYN